MLRPTRLRILSFTLVAAFCAAPALAQDAARQEDPKKEAAAWVDLARKAVRRGDWETATSQLGKARTADFSNEDAALLLSRVQEKSGDIRKALETVASLPPGVRSLTRKGELLLATGDAAGAEAAGREVLLLDENALPAQRLVAAALEDTGKREAAAEQYIELNKRWARREAEDTDDDLLAVARGRLGLFRVSDEYRRDINAVISRFEELLKRKEPAEEALIEAGDLYLAAHEDIEAKRWYTKAKEANPRSADAIFGLARQLAFRYDEIAAQAEAEKALKENPQHVPALVFLAEIALGDGNTARGEELVTRALAVNPEDARARGLRASLHYLRGAQGAFDAEVKAVLARNKYQSAPYRELAGVMEDQRRFDEALEFAERAMQVDEYDWDAHFAAGRNAMNVGDDAKAERYLRAAEKGDPFPNRYRRNFLELYDALAKFPVVKSDRFVVKLPREIEESYVPLILPAMEASLAALEKKWDFRSVSPVYVSIFDLQSDFATRTIGLPGFSAIGACFGRTVTLDSPRALPPGAFGWRATMHHEFAHVITLQLSNGRVPRWLTEGASVYEERKVSPTWDREMEQELRDAIASGEVLTLADVNNAFRGPRVLYAYYQGGLMCELIERDFGFQKLRDLVHVYGDGTETPDAVRKALGIEPEEFDRRFLAYAKDFVKDVKTLAWPSREATAKLAARLRKDKDDADGWTLLAQGQLAKDDVAAALQSVGKIAALRPGDARAATIRALIAARQQREDQAVVFANEAIAGGDDTFDVRMLLASFARKAKDFAAAKEHYARAIELFPVVTGPESPRLALASLLMGEGEGQLAAAMRLLEDHVRIAEDDFVQRGKLAGFYRDRSRPEDELRMLLEMRDVVPLPNGSWNREACTSLHERIAQVQLDRKQWADAELAAGMAAAVAAMDLKDGGKSLPALPDARRSELLTLHAETLHLLGRDDDARRRADEALRLDATNEKAGALSDKLKR